MQPASSAFRRLISMAPFVCVQLCDSCSTFAPLPFVGDNWTVARVAVANTTPRVLFNRRHTHRCVRHFTKVSKTQQDL